MARKTTPSFVVELPLLTSPGDERQLLAMFEAGKRLQNVMTQHGRAVVAAVRADPAWAVARELPARTAEQRKARGQAFQAVKVARGLVKKAFDSTAIRHKNAAGFADRLGSHVTQKLGERTFKAFEEHLYGQRGLPRFKGFKRPLKSLESKNNETMLRWDADARFLVISPTWGLEAKLPDLAKDEWLWSALQAPTKYCRLVWRDVGQARRYSVQLVQEGLAPMKASVLARLAEPAAIGGLDIGPSNLAWCTETDAGLIKFCAEVDAPLRLVRRLQRQTDRQRRAGNPTHFDEKGRFKAGPAKWNRSVRQVETQNRLSSAQANTAARRSNAHGRDINDLLTRARHWRHDGVSAKSLQKNYGRSVGARGPGMFMDELQRKAERAGGSSKSQSSRMLKTSQYCHERHTFMKKSLSERWHVFENGAEVQRDVYSAFLALHAVERIDADGVVSWAHDPVTLQLAFERLRPALEAKRLYRLVAEPVMKKKELQDHNARGSIPRSARSSKSSNRKVSTLGSVPGCTACGAVRAGMDLQRPV